jgi:hypothetical protein
MSVNVAALVAVFAFTVLMLAIFGTLYRGAVRSYRQGELDFEGIRILRWGMLGQVAIYAILALTAFFAWP